MWVCLFSSRCSWRFSFSFLSVSRLVFLCVFLLFRVLFFVLFVVPLSASSGFGDLVAVREVEHEVECREFQTEVDVLKVELGGRDINFYTEGFSVTSYAMRAGKDLLPSFRKDGISMRAVPAKRTPEGKEWFESLSKLHRPDHRKSPDFLERMRTEGLTLYSTVEKVGEDYFMKISMVPTPVELEKIDL